MKGKELFDEIEVESSLTLLQLLTIAKQNNEILKEIKGELDEFKPIIDSYKKAAKAGSIRRKTVFRNAFMEGTS